MAVYMAGIPFLSLRLYIDEVICNLDFFGVVVVAVRAARITHARCCAAQKKRDNFEDF